MPSMAMTKTLDGHLLEKVDGGVYFLGSFIFSTCLIMWAIAKVILQVILLKYYTYM